MITVDRRKGSGDLLNLFPEGTAELGDLEFADFAFTGRGPKGVPWQVGIERKTLGDLMSCLHTGRFSGHQLPGLLSAYNEVFLIVEGLVFCDLTNGLVKVREGGKWVPAQYGFTPLRTNVVLGFILTLMLRAGVHVLFTNSKKETVQYIRTICNWFTSKDFDDHWAHMQKHKPFTFAKHTIMRSVASELPGIGWKKSHKVEKHFKTIQKMANADVKEWMEIEGIGKTIATNVVKTIREE